MSQTAYHMDSLRSLILDRIDLVRRELEDFQSKQTEDSDEGNADKIDEAFGYLENLEGIIMDLVP